MRLQVCFFFPSGDTPSEAEVFGVYLKYVQGWRNSERQDGIKRPTFQH